MHFRGRSHLCAVRIGRSPGRMRRRQAGASPGGSAAGRHRGQGRSTRISARSLASPAASRRSTRSTCARASTASSRSALFTEGADVKEGDLLFVIEKGHYQAAVDEAKAGIEKAEATLKLADIEVEPADPSWFRGTSARRPGSTRRPPSRARRAARCCAQKAALERAQLNSATPRSARRSPAASAAPTLSVGNFVGPSSGSLATIVSQDPIYVSFPVTQREMLDLPQGAGRPGDRGEVGDLSPARRRQPLRARRQDQFPRRHGEPGHRHGAGARQLPQSRSHRWSTASSSRRRRERQAARTRCWCRSRRCRSTRPAPSCWWSTRTTRCRSAASRSADRAARNMVVRKGLERGERVDHRRHPEGAARPGRAARPKCKPGA